ncbi:MAG: phosphoribosyltransferase family protein, partial [Holophaga sp.]|nr:phosphoribosyltransferase family protein [Holophaga sp.]
LVALPEERCPRCALPHGAACAEPVAWSAGDALWDYRGGRPALGALLVPAIKRGEPGWKAALLERARRAALPDFAWAADLVCAAPTSLPRRWLRGFDLAEEAAAMFAHRLGKPYRPLLRKAWFAAVQAGQSQGRRRRLPASAVGVRRGRQLHGETVLLVDDVWTTGTTLLRCAQALKRAGAGDLAVLTLFRAL